MGAAATIARADATEMDPICPAATEVATEAELTGGVLTLSSISVALMADVLLASAANAINQADRNIMPIAVIPMAAEFRWSLVQRGLVLSSFAYGYILTQLPGGWVATRLPPLRLLLVAVFSWSLATLLTPAAARLGLGALFACRVLMGVAEGFCLPAIFQLFAARVPGALRSRAFALMLGCGSVGNVAALLLCPQLDAWPSMFHLFGGLGLVWAASCLLRLRAPTCCTSSAPLAEQDHRQDHEPRRGRDAEAHGGAGPRWGAERGAAEVRRRAAAAAAAAAEEEAVPMLPRRALLARLLRCKPLYGICAAHFAQNWTNSTLTSWLPTYLHEALGMETRQLSLTALPFAVNAAAGVGFAVAADRLAAGRAAGHRAGSGPYDSPLLSPRLTVRRAATLVGLLGPAACLLLLIGAGSAPLAIAAVTLSFLLGAATCSGYMANHADLSAGYAGLTFAISNTVATVPGLLAPPVTAWIVGERPTRQAWAYVFALAALVNVLGSVTYLALADARRVL
jgi:ACS family sodium-dependent inorganic phosphate cotransporter